MKEETKDKIYLGILICVIILVVGIFITSIVFLTIATYKDYETYSGPEGHCVTNKDKTPMTIECYNKQDKLVCEYVYNAKEDGHWC